MDPSRMLFSPPPEEVLRHERHSVSAFTCNPLCEAFDSDRKTSSNSYAGARIPPSHAGNDHRLTQASFRLLVRDLCPSKHPSLRPSQ